MSSTELNGSLLSVAGSGGTYFFFLEMFSAMTAAMTMPMTEIMMEALDM
jgi:hypothetical protein